MKVHRDQATTHNLFDELPLFLRFYYDNISFALMEGRTKHF